MSFESAKMTKRKAANGARTVGSLAPAPYNPRKISDARMSMLGRSMHTFGDLGGIVFNRRTERTIGGHKRVEHIPPDAVISITERYNTPTPQGTVAIGFIQFNGERFAYREVDVDEDTEKAMNIAANKHGGDWDMPKLEPLLADLRVGGFDMDLTGFDADELRNLLGEIKPLGEGSIALPDGDKPAFEQMTFTLHTSQAKTVREALDRVLESESFEGSPNVNSNGNALTRVAELALDALG